MIDYILDILKVIASVMAIIASTAWFWELRLKIKAERRLAESTEIESQIKLLKLFTEIMNIAHARGGYEVSETVIDKLLTPEIIKENDNLKDTINNAIITIPVGEASQNAAITAIWKLGKTHKVLKESSIQALTSLCKFKKEIVEPYLIDLEKKELTLCQKFIINIKELWINLISCKI